MDVPIEYYFAAEVPKVEIIHFFVRLVHLLFSFIVTGKTAGTALETFQHTSKNIKV